MEPNFDVRSREAVTTEEQILDVLAFTFDGDPWTRGKNGLREVFIGTEMVTSDVLNTTFINTPFGENNFFTDDAVGDMYITLIGTWGQTDEEKVGTGKYKPNTNHFFPMRSHSDLGTLTGLYFSWEYDADWYKPWTWEFWDNPDVYVHKILVKDVITDTDYIFCGSKEKIKSNEDTRAFFPVTTCN